jgi:AAA15 family ATPase/GTPase
MQKLTREYKSELVNLVKVAFTSGGIVTLHHRNVTQSELLHHVKTEFVTGCNYYLSNYDFRTDKRSILDESDSRFIQAQLESVCLD